jgi:hypothetical protein
MNFEGTDGATVLPSSVPEERGDRTGSRLDRLMREARHWLDAHVERIVVSRERRGAYEFDPGWPGHV